MNTQTPDTSQFFWGVSTSAHQIEGNTVNDWSAWEHKHAQTLAHTVWRRYKKPLIITENGIADRNDTLRPQFLEDHIAVTQQLRSEGVPILGYFYWSLLDNFEWDKGFWPQFGLVRVDRTTGNRTKKASFALYQRIIAADAQKEKTLRL